MNKFLNYIKYFYSNSKKHTNNNSNILTINIDKPCPYIITSRNTIKI